jgi:hypothetical protein
MKIKKIALVAMLIVGTTISAQEDAISKVDAKLTLDKTFSDSDAGPNERFEVIKVKHLSVVSSAYHGDGNYLPSNLIDNSNATAWVANQQYLDYPQKAATGSSVYFSFSDDDQPILVEIVPGYLKNDKTWKENTRIKKIQITYLDETKNTEDPIIDVVVDLKQIDGKLPMQSQYVNLMEFYTHNMAMTDFKFIKVEILEVETGSKYQDACISTINFYKKGGKTK